MKGRLFKFLNFKAMKKLKLSLQNIEGVEVLTRAQLKMVMGGDGGSGAGECTNDRDCGTQTKTCPDTGITQTSEGRCYAHSGATIKTCHWGFVACNQ